MGDYRSTDVTNLLLVQGFMEGFRHKGSKTGECQPSSGRNA